MNIAVNTRLLLKNKLEGIGWFSYETLKRITRAHPEHRFFFIFDREYDDDFIFSDNITPIVAGPPARHPVLWFLWFEFVIPSILKKINADLFVSPDGYISLRSKVPSISVIHDINFVHNPHQLPVLVRWYYNYFFKKYADKAIRIGTVSEYSKNDIHKSYGTDLNKIDVFYNGSNSIYSPVDDNIKNQTKQKYSDSENYFIFIGAITPRKNVHGLLKSFEIFKTETGLKHKLIIVGNAMHLTKEVDKIYNSMNYKEDVVFTGRLEGNQLHYLLASATALVFIPFFEGFGIPLVEAMSCNVPVICSDKTSLPEVVGDAALQTDPDNNKKVAEFMKGIVENSDLRENLIEKGKIRKEKFSWDISADRFWDCIEKSLTLIKNNKC